jgi:CheY-like chemotaxis protein
MAGVVETVRPLAEARQVSLQLESAPEALSVAGEPALLRQLFLSLLSWAVRTSSGPRVAIAGCREGREAMVGLTFVPREAHPPLLPPEMAELCQVQRIRAGMEAAAGGRARLTLRVPLQLRRVVLVVEDNPGVVELYRRILEDTGGYEVVTAPAPATAAALASELVPDAIILDILMPGQDGWIVLRSLKAGTATRRIPVIVCSVFEEPELASALGAGAYLRKPISSQGLIETVGRCLGG